MALSVVGSTPAVANSTDPKVTNATYSGPGVVETDGNVTYVWASKPQTVNVTIAAGSVDGPTDVCLRVSMEESNKTKPLSCTRAQLSANNTTTVEFAFDEWPGEAIGRHRVEIRVDHPEYYRVIADRHRFVVHVIEKNGDFDSDGLANARELELGTDFRRPDIDGDSLSDGAEASQYGTDPRDPDSDDDGVRDAVEIARGTDQMVADTDGDGLDDGDENRRGTDPKSPDTDGDGLADATEVSLASEPTDADTDGDGLDDGDEIDHGTDATQADTDGDFASDAVEVGIGTNPTNAVDVAVAGVVGSVGLLAALTVGVRRLPASMVATRVEQESDDPPSVDAGRDEQTVDDPSGEDAAATAESVSLPPALSDEQRVLDLLENHGGRIRQRRITEETDWSKSKVSRLLSRMEEDEQITKVRMGRENLITRHGEEPDGAKPPFR